MKYIRTKDGIYEEHKVPCLRCKYFPKNILTGEGGCQGETFNCVYDKADTIEELCDEFVVAYKDSEPYLTQHLSYAEMEKYNSQVNGNSGIIYGAIWTDKGLQFVARMNSEGVLELL